MHLKIFGLYPLVLSGLLIGIFSGGLGLFVFVRSENRRIGRVWCLFALSVALWGLGGAKLASVSSAQSAVLWWRITYAFGCIWIAPLFFHFVTEFLDLSRRAVHAQYAIGALFVLILPSSLFFGPIHWAFDSIFVASAGPLFPLYLLWWLGLVFYSHYKLIDRYEAVSIKKQNQIKYFFTATAIGFGGGSIGALSILGLQIYPWGNFTVAFYPLIMSYAILKHQLMDIHVVIRKTLVYSIVSALLASLYVGIMLVGARSLEHVFLGIPKSISLLAACAIAALFHPMSRRLQDFVDERFSRLQRNREQKVIEFSKDVMRDESMSAVTQSLERILLELLHPQSIAVYLKTGDQPGYSKVIGGDEWAYFPLQMPAENPWSLYFAKRPRDDVAVKRRGRGVAGQESGIKEEMEKYGIHLAMPFYGRGELLGILFLGPKSSDIPYDHQDIHVLHLLVNQATVSLERPKLLREMSGGFVHEIKMPLANITLPAELTLLEIQDAIKNKTSSIHLLPKIVTRMKYIIEQAFLASHRVDAVQQIVAAEGGAPEKIDVAEIVKKSVRVLADMMKDHQVDFDLVHDRSAGFVMGNPKQLEIVFVNLLKNAVEAMEHQTSPRRIAIRIRGAGEAVHVDVVDSGSGISPVQRESIFQSRYTTKGAKGVGLGLYLSRKIMQLHGGTIDVQSNDMPGTHFALQFPKAQNPVKNGL